MLRDNRDMNVIERLRAYASGGPLRILNLALLAVAFVTVIPMGISTYDQLQRVQQDVRIRFIQLHRLWELHPEYTGTPDTWTRFAAKLLTNRQLMFRVKAKYGSLAEQIELDYRRDLTIAEVEVVLRGVVLWALPLLVIYGAGFAFLRRAPVRPEPKPEIASLSDPRYRPRPAADRDGGPP